MRHDKSSQSLVAFKLFEETGEYMFELKVDDWRLWFFLYGF